MSLGTFLAQFCRVALAIRAVRADGLREKRGKGVEECEGGSVWEGRSGRGDSGGLSLGMGGAVGGWQK